jgi:RNA recognition motif-containing protein
MARLYIGNLSSDTMESDLEELFGRVATVASVEIIRHLRTGESRRCGYVQVDEGGDIEELVSLMDGVRLLGRRIKVMKAFEPPEPPSLPDNPRTDKR